MMDCLTVGWGFSSAPYQLNHTVAMRDAQPQFPLTGSATPTSQGLARLLAELAEIVSERIRNNFDIGIQMKIGE